MKKKWWITATLVNNSDKRFFINWTQIYLLRKNAVAAALKKITKKSTIKEKTRQE